MDSTTISRIATGLALPPVVIFNWLLAHLATTWVMPEEVSSALQTLLTYGIEFMLLYAAGHWLKGGNGKAPANLLNELTSRVTTLEGKPQPKGS